MVFVRTKSKSLRERIIQSRLEETNFYWRVVTRDKMGEETTSPEWTFYTSNNSPPNDPEFDVPSRWPVGVELCFNFSSTDPDNYSISYIIDWGDGTIDETGFYESGELIEFCHTYETKGTYTIRIRAIDEFGAMSSWSEFTIIIPTI